MNRKVSKFLPYGFLALLFLLLSSTLTVARPDNTIYPLTNYFAFNDSGELTWGLSNQSTILETGLQTHSITSEQPAYKFRLIFPSPTDPFDSLSIRLRMTFSANYTNRILWGFLRKITVNVFPFDMGIIDSENGSVQVIDAINLYEGTTITFKLNDSALIDLEYFEISFSSWNESSVIQNLMFEQIKFNQSSPPITSSTNLTIGFLLSFLSGISFFLPRKFNGILLLLLVFILVLVPITVISRVQSLIESLPETDSSVTRFTFFNVVYERKDYGNGFYSLRMVKDLSAAFELVAKSGTGSSVVYPSYNIELDTSSENHTIDTLTSSDDGSINPLNEAINEFPTPRILYSFNDITGTPSWWNSDYEYIKQVTLTANTALSTNYTVQVDLNTANLVSASKMRADGHDLRVAYYTGTEWQEVDRVVLNNNTAKSSIFFRLQSDIPALSSDPNYAIYYGYRSGDPGNAPEDTSKIFLSSDDFSAGNLNAYSPNLNWATNTDTTKPINIGWWTSSNVANQTGVTSFYNLSRTGVVTNNSQILFLMKINNTATVARIGLRSTSGSDMIALERNSTHLSLVRHNGTESHILSSTSSSLSTELWYMYKFQIVGDTLKAKVWPAGGSEPTGWTLETSDGGLPTSGNLVFSSNNSHTLIGYWSLMSTVSSALADPTPDIEETDSPDINSVEVIDDDTGVLHSQKQFYTFQVNVTDVSGYTDIDFVMLNFTVDSFEYSVGYDRVLDSFVVIRNHSSNHFTLDAASSSSFTSNNQLNLTFKILFDWDFPLGTDIQLEAWVNDTLSNSDTANSIAVYDFNHDLSVGSFSVDDIHINPNRISDLSFTGTVYYKGTSFTVGDSQISNVAIFEDPSAPTSGDKTTVADSVSSFNVDADSETTLGNYTYYPVITLVGDSPIRYLNSTTQQVAVDLVRITDISIGAHIFHDGSRYWDNNDGSEDEIWVTVTAEWNYTGKTYTGEVIVGYIGNVAAYGATSGLVRTDVEENPSVGGTTERTIFIGASGAIEGPNNDYGTQVNLDTSVPLVGWDNADPVISLNPGSTSEASNYLYYDGSSAYGYYSDNMGGSGANFIIAGTASDSGAGLQSVSDNTNFGANPSRSGTLSSWTFTYSITSSDSSYGTFFIEYTAIDAVGNSNTATFEFREDNTNPSIAHNAGSTSETSIYLYYDGSSTHGYYSDNMGGSLQNFIVAGTASDGGADLLSIVDDTTFGNNPGRGGTLSSWTFTYAIDSGDSASGTFTITYTATDNVGNTNTATFEFREDNTNPSITHTAAGTSESSSYLYYDGSSTHGYYSDNMGGSLQNFIVAGTASDPGAGLLSITDNTAFGNNPSRGGTLSSWTFTYAIDSGDSASGTFTITYTATDNVDNT
ncbi:MAG: hypothetical protein ACW97Z_15550, partial [Candidatus Hodarchaeales archaeon]